jgi:DNA (cytosine-5)-methyltransferase 1
MTINNQMLRIKDVANELNVSQKSVRRYIHSGKLKSNKIGGVHRISETELEDFLKSSIYDKGAERELE